jgi:PAS domain S-box-containing protein
VAGNDEEERLLRNVALQNANSILLARQRAEEELVRAKESLEARTRELALSLSLTRATLEATTDAILVTGHQGEVTDYNEQFVQLWRVPAETLQSGQHRTLLQHISRQFADPDGFVGRVEEIYASSREAFDELHCLDGRCIERVCKLQTIGDRPVGRVWSFRDITERKLTEQSLRHSEEELRTLANSIPQLAWMAHPNGHIFWYNRRWYEYTGTTHQQMEGWGWQLVHDPLLLPAVIGRWKHSLLTGDPFEMEFPLRGRDGQFRWFLTRVNPLREESGRIIRWFGTCTDVDHVKRVERALRDETRTLELLNETGTVIGSTLQLQELLQAITDSATKLSGAKFGAFFYNATDERGEVFQLYTLSGAPREAFERLGHPRATPLFASTFNGERPIRLEDVHQDPRYGQFAPHHGMPAGHLPVRSYLAVPVISRTAEVIGGLFFGHPDRGVFTERTERIIVSIASQAAVAIDNARLYEGLKQAAEERQILLEAERAARTEAERVSVMKDEFLATLSHELRTPLNAILGWSQLLASGKLEPDDLQQGIDAIQRNARAQTQLIEDLLDMSRIISGKVRLDVQWLDLSNVVEAAIASVRPSAEARGIRLRSIIDPHAGPVSGDPTRLQQVVWNLLTNAIKFTPKGGKVDVLLQRVNSSVELTVHDSGIGIKPEFLPQVFERFRQADSSTTRSYGGLGLGLSIVKHLVDLHGGTVRAKSEGEGHGATFVVTLPLAPVRSGEVREHPTTSRGHALPSASLDLSGIKVLIVDDEPDARHLISRVLTQCHAEVYAAASAAEAFAQVTTWYPDVLVSDIGMPEKDGYQFIREVRSLPAEQGGRVPAIALTAFARSEDRTRAMMAGYQVHIAKPIEPQELTVAVGSLAGRLGTS